VLINVYLSINLSIHLSMYLSIGDILTISTPGGGGYGVKGSTSARDSNKDPITYLKSSGSLNQFTLNQESV
jgi:N-methylhydantoinase B/oxoprolinase/acetone carboxylase alpha subunit